MPHSGISVLPKKVIWDKHISKAEHWHACDTVKPPKTVLWRNPYACYCQLCLIAVKLHWFSQYCNVPMTLGKNACTSLLPHTQQVLPDKKEVQLFKYWEKGCPSSLEIFFLLWPSKDLKLPSGFFKVLQSWGGARHLYEFYLIKRLEMRYQKKWSRTSYIHSW